MGLGSTKDDVTGSTKETAGGITGDDELRHEAQAQQARSELRQKATSMHDHAAHVRHNTVNMVPDAVRRRTGPR